MKAYWLAVALAVVALSGVEYHLGYRAGLKAQPPVVVNHIPVEPVPRSKFGPRNTGELRATLYRATLDKVAQDFGIDGQLDCRVLPKVKK